MVLAMERVELKVAQRVVHPPHVPLEPEAQAALVDRFGDAGETRGLLGDHGDSGETLVEMAVDVAQEVDGLQVLPTTVLVGHPLTLRTGVVQVEHRGHGVDAQAIDVELVDPVQGVGDEERLHLVATIVEDVGAPVQVLALTWIGMLVQGRAVETSQCPVILGEMAGHPVHDDADARLVQLVDEQT